MTNQRPNKLEHPQMQPPRVSRNPTSKPRPTPPQGFIPTPPTLHQSLGLLQNISIGLPLCMTIDTHHLGTCLLFRSSGHIMGNHLINLIRRDTIPSHPIREEDTVEFIKMKDFLRVSRLMLQRLKVNLIQPSSLIGRIIWTTTLSGMR